MAYYTKNGAELEGDYAAYSGTDGTCSYNASKGKINTTGAGYINVTPQNPDQMKAALANQTVSVSLCASHRDFQYYTSGILTSTHCGTQLDHAVLLVGWGIENGTEYWVVKNSWAADWGDQGYIRFAIVSGKGICGVQMEPVYPTL